MRITVLILLALIVSACGGSSWQSVLPEETIESLPEDRRAPAVERIENAAMLRCLEGFSLSECNIQCYFYTAIETRCDVETLEDQFSIICSEDLSGNLYCEES